MDYPAALEIASQKWVWHNSHYRGTLDFKMCACSTRHRSPVGSLILARGQLRPERCSVDLTTRFAFRTSDREVFHPPAT
jgi:hypothetical protein